MDILQQSLQAADILSGEENEDLFGELGLTFNDPSAENVELPSELASLASQGDALYNNGSGITSHTTFDGFDAVADSTGFDTSQFLNTSASVNVAASPPRDYNTATNELNVMRTSSLAAANAVRYSAQQATLAASTTQHQAQTAVASQTLRQSNAAVASQTLCLFPSEPSETTVTVAQSIPVATCNSVFSKAPTQTLTTSVQMTHSSTPSADLSQTQSVQSTISTPIQLSTPIQIIQPSSAQSQQGARQQLITVVQKPNVNSPANHTQAAQQVPNGLTVQPQQSHNLALLRVAGSKHSLNLADPQVVKALTANILQKQQNESDQTGQQPQQFVKLGQNVINVVSQRPSQQTGLRGTQQITLQNGQTIILNNGQQVQLCTAQPQSAQLQVLPAASTQNVITSVRNGQQATSSILQAARNSQLPIKGIQIASVNIPIGSSSSNTTSHYANVTSVPNNMLTIPVLAKQDGTQNTIASVASTATTQTTSMMQTQNSSTVRSLLANTILRNNASSGNTNPSQTVVQVQPVVENANGQVANVTHPQIGATLRLNLTPQQASQLTPTQVQAILKQHRATLQAKALAGAQAVTGQAQATANAVLIPDKTMQTNQNNLTPVSRPFTPNSTANSTTPVSKLPEQGNIQVFKVDPTLTEVQVEEVKKLLANRTIASKLSTLTREQQQLVLAFQAQIKAMSPPIQQYYLRNPQLFMQKVLQQIRVGKPFILQVKTDPQQKTKIVTTVTTPKPQHPTISLTQDPNRANRANAAPPVAVTTLPAQAKNQQVVSVIGKPVVLPNMTSTVTVPKRAIKRPAPEATTKLSLVLEQLECHKKMVTNPDCIHRFKSVRDAIRRLVPFHTCNIPSVKQEDFDESEKIFDRIADRIAARTRSMVNKYHLLCLRDSTRDACSAEMVMIERMFLQKEKAKFAEDKTRLQENPSLIREYFPRRHSGEVIAIESDDEETPHNTQQEGEQPIHFEPYLNEGSAPGSPTYDADTDSSFLDSDANALSRSACSKSDSRLVSEGRYPSHDSSTSVKRLKTDHTNFSSHIPSEDTLLQAAVDSILL